VARALAIIGSGGYHPYLNSLNEATRLEAVASIVRVARDSAMGNTASVVSAHNNFNESFGVTFRGEQVLAPLEPGTATS